MTDKTKKILYLYEQAKKTKEISGTPPLTFIGNGTTLKNYRIYGNTVNGESVGDRTGNLFDSIVTNEIIQNDGSTSSNNNWRCSDFIRSDSESITLSWESNIGYFQAKVAYYSSDKTFISLEDVGKNNTFQESFVLPSGASVIRVAYSVVVNGNPANRENIMLNTGSTALPYEPYGYRVPVTVEGRNLFDEEWTQGGVGGIGNIDNELQNRIKTIVSVIPSQTYTIRTNLLIRMIFAYNDTTETSGRVSNLLNIADGVEFATITIPNNANLIAVALMGSDNLNITPSDVEWTMLNSGSEPLPYEPYQSPLTIPLYIPEQIKTVGDEAEYIDYGEQRQHFADGTSIDVALHDLPTLSGTNTLSVGTEVQPSRIQLKGKIAIGGNEND